MKGQSSVLRQILALPYLAWRNIRRNRRRTIVLAFGLIISVSVLTGIFTYIDTTNAALIQRSIEDLSVDISVNFANRSTPVEEVNKVVDYIENVIASNMILQADRICGGMPYDDWEKEGFVINEVGSNESATNPSREPTFVFGVDFSYFTLVQSVFSFLNVSGSINSIDTGMAFISKPLAESKGWTIGQNLSIGMSKATTISLFGIPIRRSKIVKQVNVTVNDFMELDLKIFMDNLMAFIPELANSFFADILSMLPFIGVSFNVAFIKYETMMQMTENYTDSRAIHGIHMAIDHDNLGADINKVLTELAAFDTALTNNFPNLLITNFARETIENLQDQLTEYRLFIYYFSLPGLLLGLFVSLYVNELTLSERKEETLILRLRNARYSQTNAITILEAVIISVIGALLGLSLGAILGTLVSQEESFSLKNSRLEDLFPEITLESFFTALFIALILTIILTFVFVRDLSSQEAVQAFHSEREIARPYWSRYGIDIVLLIIVAFTVIFREFNINPVPTFAIDFYNLIVPLLLWIGLSLCLMRILSWLIQRMEKPMLFTFPLILGNSGKSIARYIVRNRHRLIQPILIIVLSLSFAATLANVTATFNEQSVKESQYSIGADIRVKLPSMNQLEFNTSDLRKDIESLDSVETVTETFVTLLPWGWGFALLVGIEPEQFYKVSFFQKDFFLHQSPKETLSELNSTPGGLGLIPSFNLNYPYADGPDDPTLGPGIFKRNDTIPLEVGSRKYEIRILDVALRFPAIAEMVGKAEDEIPFLVTDTRLLLKPLPGQKMSILGGNSNASQFYIKVKEGYLKQEVVDSINRLYIREYPHTYALLIDTSQDYHDKFYRLGSLLIGLTELEFALVLIVLCTTLILFMISTWKEQQKEFAIFRAIGWPDRLSIRFIWFSLVLIGFLSVGIAMIMTFVSTQTYVPLISGLFKFSLSHYVLDWSGWWISVGALTLSISMCFVLSWLRLVYSPTAELLREE